MSTINFRFIPGGDRRKNKQIQLLRENSDPTGCGGSGINGRKIIRSTSSSTDIIVSLSLFEAMWMEEMGGNQLDHFDRSVKANEAKL